MSAFLLLKRPRSPTCNFFFLSCCPRFASWWRPGSVQPADIVTAGLSHWDRIKKFFFFWQLITGFMTSAFNGDWKRAFAWGISKTTVLRNNMFCKTCQWEVHSVLIIIKKNYLATDSIKELFSSSLHMWYFRALEKTEAIKRFARKS